MFSHNLLKYMNMNAKHYKNCQNNYKYLNKYEDDEFIIDKKIKRNYRNYKQKIDITTDSDSFEEENEKQKNSMKNKSIKNVIEKFNRLSCNNNFNPRICDDLAPKPPEQIEISTNQLITDKSEKKSVYKDKKKCKRVNRKEKINSSSKNSEKSLIKYSGPKKLRCSERIASNNNDFFNIFKVPDEYIRFIDEVRRKNIIKYTPKNTLDNLQLSKNELKHFKSIKTQTSPYSSNTNILINVYNAPSPRIYNNLETCNKFLQLKVSQNDQFKLAITEELHDIQNGTMKEVGKKKSVKNCVQEFEEFMKKKGLSNDKNMFGRKKVTKYKSNHIEENASETLLSTRAKSVPF